LLCKLIISKNIYKYRKLLGFFCFLAIGFFLWVNNIFSRFDVITTLWISAPSFSVTTTPSHNTGQYTSGFVYVTITWNGIKPNTTWILDNGTYTIWFYRGTWAFNSGASYSSGNMWNNIYTKIMIDWIDNTPPTFFGVNEWGIYSTPVSITFTDNLPWLTATINWMPFLNGWTISSDWTYQLIVKDQVGNITGATFFIHNNDIPNSWGGWNGIWLWIWTLIDPICKQRNCYSSYYDQICGTCSPPANATLPSIWNIDHYTTPTTPSIFWSSYPKERNDAYIRAYNLGITTMPTIQKADMNWLLFRKIAAQMVSEFAVKVIGRLPDKTKKCIFTDIDKENLELQYYIKRSCQLGIMWLDYYGNPDTTFNPNYFVTRAQFITILSRLLFKDIYNIKKGEITIYDKVRNFVSHTVWNISILLGMPIEIDTPLDWYTKHFNIIKKIWVITDYTLTIKEARWYIMIIMYRLDKLWITNIQKLSTVNK